MADSWHDCISADLDRVEEVMSDVTDSENTELTEMCRYVIGNHGKRIRPAMCILSYHACGGTDSRKAVDVGAAIELIHNATLIHDDINDQGDLRRGAKALYKEYTIGKSIVAGDYLFSLGFRLLGVSSDSIIDYVIDAASGLAAGEFSQKKYERNAVVGESQYMDIIGGKTARLIECAGKCGAYLAHAEVENIEQIGQFSFCAGLAFQIIDDILDVAGTEKVLGKRTGNDIVEGKPTLPIIYAMEDPKVGARVKEIFCNQNSDYDDAAECIALIKQTDSLERCYKKAEEIAEEAKSYLGFAPDSEYKRALEGLVDFFVSRNR